MEHTTMGMEVGKLKGVRGGRRVRDSGELG